MTIWGYISTRRPYYSFLISQNSHTNSNSVIPQSTGKLQNLPQISWFTPVLGVPLPLGFELFCLKALHHLRNASTFMVCLSKKKLGSIPPMIGHYILGIVTHLLDVHHSSSKLTCKPAMRPMPIGHRLAGQARVT